MADHIEINRHLHDAGFETAIGETFLGQAHIAGTGPDGKTCRECSLWFIMARPDKDMPMQPSSPGHRKADGELKRAKCNQPIPHKANRRVPHHAKACRFFDQSENPPVERKEK